MSKEISSIADQVEDKKSAYNSVEAPPKLDRRGNSLEEVKGYVIEVDSQIDKLLDEISTDIEKSQENKAENAKLITGLEGCATQCTQLKGLLDELSTEHESIRAEIG